MRSVTKPSVITKAFSCNAGPVDAAYKAIDALVRVEVNLEDYAMNAVTEGIEALAVTRVIIRPTGTLAAQGVVKSAQVCVWNLDLNSSIWGFGI